VGAQARGPRVKGYLEVSAVKGRLSRLEGRMRGGRCSECGLVPDGPGYIVFIDDGSPAEGFPDDPDERCSRCGRWLWFVIKVVYDSPADSEGGGGYRWP
jgi:hypothetical protein